MRSLTWLFCWFTSCAASCYSLCVCVCVCVCEYTVYVWLRWLAPACISKLPQLTSFITHKKGWTGDKGGFHSAHKERGAAAANKLDYFRAGVDFLLIPLRRDATRPSRPLPRESVEITGYLTFRRSGRRTASESEANPPNQIKLSVLSRRPAVWRGRESFSCCCWYKAGRRRNWSEFIYGSKKRSSPRGLGGYIDKQVIK